jgi:ribonucleoside-diphosphate reductase alpha chain
MGLSLHEKPEEKTDRAIEFYNVLSTFHFVSSTPTLFNSGTRHSQLSSCFLSTVVDDLSISSK